MTQQSDGATKDEFRVHALDVVPPGPHPLVHAFFPEEFENHVWFLFPIAVTTFFDDPADVIAPRMAVIDSTICADLCK